jgi:hypothetical protein
MVLQDRLVPRSNIDAGFGHVKSPSSLSFAFCLAALALTSTPALAYCPPHRICAPVNAAPPPQPQRSYPPPQFTRPPQPMPPSEPRYHTLNDGLRGQPQPSAPPNWQPPQNQDRLLNRPDSMPAQRPSGYRNPGQFEGGQRRRFGTGGEGALQDNRESGPGAPQHEEHPFRARRFGEPGNGAATNSSNAPSQTTQGSPPLPEHRFGSAAPGTGAIQSSPTAPTSGVVNTGSTPSQPPTPPSVGAPASSPIPQTNQQAAVPPSAPTPTLTPTQQPSSPAPSTPVYTFKVTPSGTVQIFQNGTPISTGTPQYAAQFGYTGPGYNAPLSSSPAQAAPPPTSSQTFYIQSGTGAQLTADQIRSGTFPPGTFFIQSGTGAQVTQAQLLGTTSSSAGTSSSANVSSSGQGNAPASGLTNLLNQALAPPSMNTSETTPATNSQALTPSTPDAISAVDTIVGIASACGQKNCVSGFANAGGEYAIEQGLVLSGFIAPSSAETRTYQIATKGGSLILTIAKGVALVAGSELAVPISIAGTVYYVTEIALRPTPVQ